MTGIRESAVTRIQAAMGTLTYTEDTHIEAQLRTTQHGHSSSSISFQLGN